MEGQMTTPSDTAVHIATWDTVLASKLLCIQSRMEFIFKPLFDATTYLLLKRSNARL